LIQQKQSQIRKLQDDQIALESRKSDKQLELVAQIDTSLKKLTELCATQEVEMTQYEETEQLAVDEKKKRLHYERIRI
jgi:enamine deaminase RidA (YjgF/YER057c/UK114 family)